MEGRLLDKNYDTKGIIDTFESFIWTDRFLGYGDFEIFLPVESDVVSLIQQDDYISVEGSNRYMIIEQLELTSDPETGTNMIVSGRSLESILDRRIIWGQMILSGNLQDAIERILIESIINPSNVERKIPNFIFRRSTDPTITELTINAQFIGDNVYDAIYIMCEEAQIGFRILPDEETGGFIFELYTGVDRSYSQDSIPHVVFSPEFDNLLSSNYFEGKRALKTAALVGGEGEGSEQITTDVSFGLSGLDRREVYVEATDISSTTDDGEVSAEDYQAMLEEKGYEALVETINTSSFEGEIDASIQFVYSKDFEIGDIVQVSNEYGMESRARVSELVRTHDADGETFYPTFVTVEEAEVA